MDALVKNLFERHSVMSAEYLKNQVLQALNTVSNNAANPGMQAACMESLKRVLDGECLEIRGNYVLKQVGDTSIDKVSFVMDFFDYPFIVAHLSR